MIFDRDNYNGFLINTKKTPIAEIREKLPAFLALARKDHFNYAVKVDVYYESAAIIPFLKEHGFTFFYSDDEYAQWVYKNGSPIPDRAALSSIRAYVLMVKGGKLLGVELKDNKWVEGKIQFPGGNVDLDELDYDAGIREIYEEVGLTIESMDLIGVLSRIKNGPLTVSDVAFFYVCNNFSGEVKTQEKEINKTVWIPLETCASATFYDGLKIDPLHNVLAQYVLSGRSDPDFKRFYCCEELRIRNPGYLRLIG